MIGAAPRPSLRDLVIAHAIYGVHAAAKIGVVLTAAGLTIAALPLLLVLRWIDFDDEPPPSGDSGVA